MNLRLAAPAIVLASLLLLPFLDKPFTIDDPLFLRAAQHALVDPAHPGDFEQVWNAGDRLKLSQYWLGGTLPAYVLMPVAALGSREWVAHLYQWMLLIAFLLACVAVSRRLGFDARQANVVGLLVGSNPVTLAMSATVMPDLMAVTFGTWGIERVLAYREERGWGPGVGAGLLLAAGVLCRANTAPLIVVAALALWPREWRYAVASLWPAGLGVALALAGAFANSGVSGSFSSLTSLGNAPRNLVSFLGYQAMTGPLLVYWIAMRGRWALAGVAGMTALGVALATVPNENLRQYAVPAALGLCFLAAVVDLAQELRHAVALLVWLGAGLIALPYVYMAAKYLLPGVPAAALLIVLHAARVRQTRWPLTVAVMVALGWVSGALIIVGDTMLASSARQEVSREKSRPRQGGTMWAAGQWSFLEYAQRAGAHALGNQPPYPRPGDFILVSRLDYYDKLDQMPLVRDYLYSTTDRRCGVFVLNRAKHAGFFSNRFGYLPFAIGCGELNRYDMYRVVDTLKN